MLQQTQVSTVIPYFNRFITALPDIQALADAPTDQILQLWTGLGYYSRARNLHRAARIICRDYGGNIPADQALIEALPGIGRSTAGAILSIAFGQRAAILDGNVKRVLARYHGIDGWPGDPKVASRLWDFAEQHTPTRDVAAYTQAIMDLGAMVCTRSKPVCEECPLSKHCLANIQKDTLNYPGKKPRKMLPTRSVQLLLLRNRRGEVLLQQRVTNGIWGGLWCFPEITPDEDVNESCQKICGKQPRAIQQWPSWRHTFSHFHLHITPVLLDVTHVSGKYNSEDHLWVRPDVAALPVGVAAPTRKLLEQLAAC